jgi:hypothetical protein
MRGEGASVTDFEDGSVSRNCLGPRVAGDGLATFSLGELSPSGLAVLERDDMG